MEQSRKSRIFAEKEVMSPYIVAFIILTALFVILTIIGSRMDQQIRIEVQRHVKAETSEVFVEIGNFERFVLWSPWTGKDQNMKSSLSGELLSVGSIYQWKGNRSVGEGRMEITHIEVNRKIEMDLEFGRRALSKTGFILEETENGTLITWYFESDLGPSPMNRLAGPLMKKFIRADFEKGLQQLEQHLETR